MTSSENLYLYNELDRSVYGTKYFFVSVGREQLVKVVEYAYVGVKEGRLTYNLGFGTYGATEDKLLDIDLSNNGDAYRVLNTVLSTVPHFLCHYPGAMIMVAGSDSADAFPKYCRTICKKKCIPPDCKNANRRINIYRRFVNKNFAALSNFYRFLGGVKINNVDNEYVVEEYVVKKNYDSVFLVKNNS
ncbi:MAG: hypothetical protein P0Y53_10950 [Candidatus Pseudobacter hemicellulosilyticus]|uniref:Uncharacterized protein n=1 Tax=Candidatus Pseudobacter hemicellulosilyticus TaxID=3121375 RepID=A0AAJ5WWU8_9BACT|nr:MAG: hypothetical protein P0Y53_10950 [Pseudobacter sp.]